MDGPRSSGGVADPPGRPVVMDDDGSGREGAPASPGASLMSDFLDRSNTIHRRVRSGAGAGDDDGPRVGVGCRSGREDLMSAQPSRRRPSLASFLWPPSRATTVGAGNDDGKGGGGPAAWRGWRPVRALAHLGKRSVRCLFAVEVGAARGMPASMEGSRLAVAVRKAETRDGAARTAPCPVRDGDADFDGRTLFVWCYLYFTGGVGTGRPLRLRPRRFVVSVVSVEGRGAVLGTHVVDVSALVLESPGRVSSEGGQRTPLTFAAAGGEMQLKLGFQLMERVDENGDPDHHPAVSRSLIPPRKPGDDELSACTSDTGDVLSLPPEYEIVEKEAETDKQVVHYQDKRDVTALMTNGAGGNKSPKAGDQQQRLDGVGDKKELELPVTPRSESAAAATPPVVPDLGRGIGPAVQTSDGGFLVSMNPFDMPLASRDGPPKLAMQVSRPFVLPGATAATGFDVLQKMAAAGGADEVRDRVASLGGMDNITGKTPELVRFEGIVAAVIGGRRTEGSVRLVRKLATALSEGRSERDDPETLDQVLAFSLPKLANMAVDALAVQAEMADEDAPSDVSAASAGDTNQSVFDSLVPSDEWSESSAGGVSNSDERVTLVAAIQVRDPWRRYEAVGAPMVAVVQSARLLGAAGYSAGRFEVESLHVGGVRMRCPPSGGGGSAETQKLTAMRWMLAHGPAARAGKRATTPTAQARSRVQRPDVVWSLSSQVLAGMWLKTVRNPDVSIGKGGGT